MSRISVPRSLLKRSRRWNEAIAETVKTTDTVEAPANNAIHRVV